MSIAQLLAHHDPALTTFELDVPDQWKQGRTVYGGLSSGLCLQAALPHANGRPLRSAMINFVGPSAGLLTVEAEKLRDPVGRNWNHSPLPHLLQKARFAQLLD